MLTVPSDDGVVICADRRKTNPDGSVFTDEADKLVQIDQTNLVFSVGGTEVWNSGKVLFDANAAFVSAFRDVGRGHDQRALYARFVDLVLRARHIVTAPLPREVDPETGLRHIFSTVHISGDASIAIHKIRFDSTDNSDVSFRIEERSPRTKIWPFGKHLVFRGVRERIVRRDAGYSHYSSLLAVERSIQPSALGLIRFGGHLP